MITSTALPFAMASVLKSSTEKMDVNPKNDSSNDVESSIDNTAEAGTSVIIDPEGERSYGKPSPQ